MNHTVGVVIIGRNEGQRLVACLSALVSLPYRRIYVDSMSTDHSVSEAIQLGAEVVQLDDSEPLTAARARNVGVNALSRDAQTPSLIQFVDGDTVLADDWLEKAAAYMDRQPETAVVCGHLRERFVDRSIFHRLCDMEWSGDVGAIEASGGIFMVRRQAFEEVNGFVSGSVAGEEADLCRRLRRCGWKIERIDCHMGDHDVAIDHWGQWWRRTLRGGYGYAERVVNQGFGPDARSDIKRIISVLTWAVAMPLLFVCCLVLAFWSPWWWIGSSLVLLLHARLLLNVYRFQTKRGRTSADARLYALFCLLSKYPEAFGLFRFIWMKMRNQRSRWIQYKQVR